LSLADIANLGLSLLTTTNVSWTSALKILRGIEIRVISSGGAFLKEEYLTGKPSYSGHWRT
jgi:hypothetical protein